MRRLFATATILAFALPTAAFAQEGAAPMLAPDPVPAAVVTTPVVTTPVAGDPAPTAMVHADVAGIRGHDSATDAHAVNAVAASSGLHQGQGMALMVVGGAALVGGLLIGGSGGDAVAIGGLAVGLIGLYQYVR